MTKKDQNDLIIPFSYFLDDFIENAEIDASLIESLEEKHLEMASELAAVKGTLSEKEYWRQIVMWFVAKDRFFEDILYSDYFDNYLYDRTIEPQDYLCMASFSYWDYGQDSSDHQFYVFEYGSKYFFICYSNGEAVDEVYGTGVVESLEELEEIFESLDSVYRDMTDDFGMSEFGKASASYRVKGKDIEWSVSGNKESDDYIRRESDFVFELIEDKPVEDLIISSFEYGRHLFTTDITVVQNNKDLKIPKDAFDDIDDQLSDWSGGGVVLGEITVERNGQSLRIKIVLVSSYYVYATLSAKMNVTLIINGKKKVISNVDHKKG